MDLRSRSRELWKHLLRKQARRSGRSSFQRSFATLPRLCVEPLEDRLPLFAGDLDPTFGNGGKVTTDFLDWGSQDEELGGFAVQPADGKIVAAGLTSTPYGSRSLLLARYSSDGQPDISFGDHGVMIDSQLHGFTPEDILVQSDGMLVVIGNISATDQTWAVARFDTHGNIDTTFGVKGLVTIDTGNINQRAWSGAIQPDGKIVIAGTGESNTNYDFVVARITSQGTLDPTFDADGLARADFNGSWDEAYAVAIQADEKIVVGGRAYSGSAERHDFAVARFSAGGALDPTFDEDGWVVTHFNSASSLRDDWAQTLKIQEDGKIVAAGRAGFDLAIARYTSQGELDPTFHTDGRITTSFSSPAIATSIDVGSDGTIIVGGEQSATDGGTDLLVARFTPSGNIDVAFGTDGWVSIDLAGAVDDSAEVILQSDGNVLLAGSVTQGGTRRDLGIARLTTSGSLDVTFGNAGRITTDVIGVGSNRDRAVAAYVDNATGKTILAGITIDTGGTRLGITRHHPDGSLDTSFASEGRFETGFTLGRSFTPHAVKLDPTGRIVVAGTILPNGDMNFGVIRLTSNGVVDSAFGIDGIATSDFSDEIDRVSDLAIQADGRVIVAGSTGGGDFGIVRFTPDGQLDTSFDADGQVSIDFGGRDTANAIVLQDDGKILVAGESYRGGSDFDFVLARLRTTGQFDSDFDGDGRVTSDFGSTLVHHLTDMALQSDGRIVVAGSSYLGEKAMLIARYTSNGALDPLFDSDGVRVEQLPGFFETRGLAIQSDDKIVVLGTQNDNQIVFSRFRSNGTLDNDYGNQGRLISGLLSSLLDGKPMVIGNDDRVTVAGTEKAIAAGGENFAFLRLTDEGEIDTTVDGDGVASTDFPGMGSLNNLAEAVAIQGSDGKIIVAGMSYQSPSYMLSLSRYTPIGELDPSFGSSGRVIAHIPAISSFRATDVAWLSDGKILVLGQLVSKNGLDFGLMRFNSDGSLDLTFNEVGWAHYDMIGTDDVASSMVVQTDGRILLAGSVVTPNRDTAIVRVMPDGTLDHSFDGDGRVITDFGLQSYFLDAIAITSDGEIIVAGELGNLVTICRYLSNGQLDTSFDSDGIAVLSSGSQFSEVGAIAQPDNKILIAASFDGQMGVARLLTNGALDDSFDGDGFALMTIPTSAANGASRLSLQADGKIVVGGHSNGGTTTSRDFALARFLPNGSPDLSFNGNGFVTTDFNQVTNQSTDLAIQDDGSIVVIGYSHDGSQGGINFALARYLGAETKVSLDATGNLSIVDTALAGKDDSLIVELRGEDVFITDPNNLIAAGAGVTQVDPLTVGVPLAAITGQLHANLSGGNDSLHVRFDGGSPVPVRGMVLNADAGVDSLVLSGGNAESITHSIQSSGSGTITVTGANAATISYSGLEPIDDQLLAAHREFVYGSSGDAVTLIDAPGAAMAIDTALSEPITFAVPSASLSIRTGAGNDTITVTSVDATFGAAIAIEGSAGNDRVAWNADITFAAGKNLDINLAHASDFMASGDIVIGSGANLAWAGVGSATLRASMISTSAGSSIATVDGDVSLAADAIAILEMSSISAGPNHSISLAPNVAGMPISIGSNDSLFLFLGLTDSELDRLTAGSVRIGDSNSGNLTTTATITHSNNLSLATGATVTFNEAVTMAENKNFSVQAASTIDLPAFRSDITTSGAGSIQMETARNIVLRAGSVIQSTDGNITLRANQQAVGTLGSFSGVNLSGGAVQSVGRGIVTVLGRGGSVSNGSLQHGVIVSSNQTVGKIAGGNVPGVLTTYVEGHGGFGGEGSNNGVVATLSGLISSGGGDVVVIGHGGQGNQGSNYGVSIWSHAEITAGGMGNVTVWGEGGGLTWLFNHGVAILNSGILSSSGGNVQVTGISGTPIYPEFSRGVAVEFETSSIRLPAGGDLTIIADRVSVVGTASISVSPGHRVSFLPALPGQQVNLGARDGLNILGLEDYELDRVSTGTIAIGSSNSGPLLISENITRANPTNLQLTSGDTIHFTTGSIHSGGGPLELDTGSALIPARAGVDITAGSSVGISFDDHDVLRIELSGNVVDVQYQQLNVEGRIDLAGLRLELTGAYQPAAGETFVIVNNDLADLIDGAFDDLPEGSIVNHNGVPLLLSYQGGDGNDVVLTAPWANQPPQAELLSTETLEDFAVEIDLWELTSDFETPDAALTFVVEGAEGGTVELLADGHTARFLPNPEYHGPARFLYSVTDGGNGDLPPETTGPISITIQVLAVNDQPQTQSANLPAQEDSPIEIDLWDLVEDVEAPDADLEFHVGGHEHGVAELLPDGHTVRFTPAQFYSGPASFHYYVTDTGDDTAAAITTDPVVVHIDVEPRPATHLVLNSVSATTAARTFSITVQVRNAVENPAVGYRGVVRFQSSDPTAALPFDYAFKASDAGTRTFFIALSTPGVQTVTLFDVSNETLTGTTSLPVYPLFTVFTTADTGDGSLRQAIVDANNNADLDTIRFDIPADDPNHLYYRDDGIAGQVSGTHRASTTAANDSELSDIDPDWPHSWWSIQPTTTLPFITQPAVIDGYSQEGSRADSGDRPDWQTTGIDSVLRIELAGHRMQAGELLSGLVVAHGNPDIEAAGTIVKGMVINRFASDTTGNDRAVELLGGGNHRIQGNFIGTDVSGTLPASGQVNLTAHFAPVTGMHIGVWIWQGSRENWVGSDGDGIDDAAERNLISGTTAGVGIGGPARDNVIAGNLIGTDRTGTREVSNWFGIALQTGTTGNRIGTAGTSTDPAAERNIISANKFGIGPGSPSPSFSDLSIAGNFIGTDVSGTQRLGNKAMGIAATFGASSTQIGGTDPVLANTIAFNMGPGVWIFDTASRPAVPTGISVVGNSIYENDGLGIEIGGDYRLLAEPFGAQFDGPNVLDAGDVDSGPNELQNAPNLYAARIDAAGDLVASFFVDSATTAAAYDLDIDFYKADAKGQGRTHIGRRHFTGSDLASGIRTDTLGSAASVAGGVGMGDYIVATATDQDGNTSEFSAAALVTSAFVVTNTEDDGTGSLRQAILNANHAPNAMVDGELVPDRIEFQIATGPQTIAPSYALPQITESVMIDGSTQPGYAGKPIIELSGVSAGANVDGLMLLSESSLIRSLVLNGFSGNGIVIRGGGQNAVVGSYIGTDVTGEVDLGNAQDGIRIEDGAHHTLIGGFGADERNIISGNEQNGIRIAGLTTFENRIVGNFIGTNAAGGRSVGNTIRGILVHNAPNNTIGGSVDGAGNVISGTTEFHGIAIMESGATGNVVAGNKIGTNAAGTVAIPNKVVGVAIEFGAHHNILGGIEDLARNVISGNAGPGVVINTSSWNTVLGNYIGVDASGSSALGNGHEGLQILHSHNNVIGGSTEAAKNVISGNHQSGLTIYGTSVGNGIYGNHIGTDAAGLGAVGNQFHGVYVAAANNQIGAGQTGMGNLISGNGLDGISFNRWLEFATEANTVQGNFIGTDISGHARIPNLNGIALHNQARSNLIGSDVNGTTDAMERNVVSGNSAHGILITDLGTVENIISGNFVGTDASGAVALGNSVHGIVIQNGASSNRVGTDGDGLFDDSERNIISGNGNSGVLLVADRNVVAGNYIGTDWTGTQSLGNLRQGVAIRAPAVGNIIGTDDECDPSTTEGNVIAFNGLFGVGVVNNSAVQNRIRGNLLFANGALEIDLGTNGATANDNGDVDGGANLRQNYPEITRVTPGSTTTVVGRLSSSPNTSFILDFYSSNSTDPTGHGHAQKYLGCSFLTLDQSGVGEFHESFPIATDYGEYVTATATDQNGNTSEFSLSRLTNVAPVANAGGPYSIEEGASVELDASRTFDEDGDALTYSWDLNGDGIFGDTSSISTKQTISWAELNALGIVDGPSSFTVSLRVEDPGGYSVVAPAATLTVTNVAPTAWLSQNGPVTYGESVTVSFTDPDDSSQVDISAGFRYAFSTDPLQLQTASYENSSELPTETFELDAGIHTVYARIFDQDEGFTQYQTEVVVQKARQTLHWPDPADILEGTPLTAAQLNATVSVSGASTPGGLTYTPAAGLVLGTGVHRLQVKAAETANYLAETSTVTLRVLKPYSISGRVIVDFNNDQLQNFGEVPIAGVSLELRDSSETLVQTVSTDTYGQYVFNRLWPGDYSVSELQPAGFSQGINSVGTLGGVQPAIDQFFLELGEEVVDPGIVTDGREYNFAERPTATTPVETGESASTQFWKKNEGQSVIRSLNGGASATELGNWLALTFPNLYGPTAGANSMAEKTNAQVADRFSELFRNNGRNSSGPPKLDAEILATALNVYVTNPSLTSVNARSAGFRVTTEGLGYSLFDVGKHGVAFGVPNNSTVAVLDLLFAVDARSRNGRPYDEDGSGSTSSLERSLQDSADAVFSDTNKLGRL